MKKINNVFGYVHAIRGAFIAFLVFIVIAIYLPSGGGNRDIELILTISTFIFAILVGFFISRLNNRYDTVRDLMAKEDGLWTSYYRASMFFGKKFQQRMKKIIDNYYIVMFDFELDDYYKPTVRYFEEAYKELNNNVKFKKNNSDNVFDDMVVTLQEIETTRNTTSVLGGQRLTLGQWSILLTLSFIIVFCLYYLVSGIIFKIIMVILSTAIVTVLLTVRDLQNFRLGGKLMVEESGQEVFEALGVPRYYHKSYLKQGVTKIPKNIKEFRIGQHELGEKLDIKLIKRK
jgi:hypothetical protein